MSKQEGGPKTFQEICPRWSKKINVNPGKASIVDHKILDMIHFKRCCAGEAWGFSENYHLAGKKQYCDDCFFLALDFVGIIDGRNDKEDTINRFTQHWNEAHV